MSTAFKIKIFADGADPKMIAQYADDARVQGFTTNPTLMKQAGITDYEGFAKELLTKVTKPISFEVFTDELDGMLAQARKIATWGKNIFVKIPVTNSKGESAVPVIQKLSNDGVKLNITALFTLEQTMAVHKAVHKDVPAILSVFAGRIADTGRDPVPVMQACRRYLNEAGGKSELLWASSRELYNIVQAEACGTDIITVTPEILKKLAMVGKDLVQLSLETVQMFKRDAEAAGFRL